MKPATKMTSYQKSPPSIDKDDDAAALLLGKWMMTGRSLGLVAVGAVLMLLAGAVLMQDGSYDYSSGSFAPTRKAFMAQYPELLDRSSEEQDFQYQAYLLSLNGMLSEELDGDKANSFGLFSCCLDEKTSTVCHYKEGKYIQDQGCYEGARCGTCLPADHSAHDTECKFAGGAVWNYNEVCCRSSPYNRVGSRNFVFQGCTL